MATFTTSTSNSNVSTILRNVFVSSSSTTIPVDFSTDFNCSGVGTLIVNNSPAYVGGSAYTCDDKCDNNDVEFIQIKDNKIDISLGEYREIKLPDGTIIYINADGSFRVEDKDAKVVYKASRIKEFNRYLNAGDLIEEFIADLGRIGITQSNILQVPINAFFVWLVWKSAEADQEQPPSDTPKLEALPEIQSRLSSNSCVNPRCRCCGQFIDKRKAELGINFCNDRHLAKFMEKHKL